MPFPKKGPDPFFPAALGLSFVLAVVLAAAGIRIAGLEWLRPVHRVAASLEVLVVIWLAWIAWRRPAVWLAVALSVLLSVAGIVGGQQPGAALSALNLLGGLALAGTFAWIASRDGQRRLVLLGLLGVQACLGAALSIFEAPIVPLHAMLALALTALVAWLSRGRPALVALAGTATLAGFTALHYERSALAALAHAASAALLLAAAAWTFARKP